MSDLPPGLVIAPIVLPLVSAALLLLLGDNRRSLRDAVNIAATLAGLAVAVALLTSVDAGGATGRSGIYLASNWQPPFGIVLVADRLSALMLLLVGLVSSGVAVYAQASWSRAGAYFQPLFQLQLLGLNGAFLTGDLFNLFVFFEVLLAASYGLQLHGSGWPRVRSGMHYLAVNLLASALFLVGLAVIYGVMGTLSLADLADRMAAVPSHDRGLVHAGAAILAVAFLTKAAIWPLNAWLVPAYTAASVPVAALFVLMTKVGFYATLRLWTLLFSSEAGGSPHFGGDALLLAGMATLAFGAIGILASIRLERVAAFSVVVSSGTLLAALGMHSVELTGAALFYLMNATLAASALFLLVELVKRTSVEGQAQRPEIDVDADPDDNLDDLQEPMIGRAVPVPVALLGLAFVVCALLVAGLPPLAGFVAKTALIYAALDLRESAPPAAWSMLALLLLAGLFTTISLARAGIRHFWSKGGRFAPRLKAAEGSAVVWLLTACLLLTIFAEPAVRYARATAESLHSPRAYIGSVLAAPARPGPSTPSEGTRVP